MRVWSVSKLRKGDVVVCTSVRKNTFSVKVGKQYVVSSYENGKITLLNDFYEFREYDSCRFLRLGKHDFGYAKARSCQNCIDGENNDLVDGIGYLWCKRFRSEVEKDCICDKYREEQ